MAISRQEIQKEQALRFNLTKLSALSLNKNILPALAALQKDTPLLSVLLPFKTYLNEFIDEHTSYANEIDKKELTELFKKFIETYNNIIAEINTHEDNIIFNSDVNYQKISNEHYNKICGFYTDLLSIEAELKNIIGVLLPKKSKQEKSTITPTIICTPAKVTSDNTNNNNNEVNKDIQDYRKAQSKNFNLGRSNAFFDDVPDDILLQIISEIDITEVKKFALISKRWRDLVNKFVNKLQNNPLEAKLLLSKITINNLLFSLEQNCRSGSVQFISLLLLDERIGIDNKYNNDEMAMLHWACASKKSNLELVKFLIEKGATVNIQDRLGYTPLHFAALFGHTEICEFLLSINPSQINDCEFLHVAKNADVIELLLKFGADIEKKNDEGMTPFTSQINRGKANNAACLIEHGANVNISSMGKIYDDMSPLHVAAENGDLNSIKLLIKHGADVFQVSHSVDYNNMTPRKVAIRTRNCGAVIKYLEMIEEKLSPLTKMKEQILKETDRVKTRHGAKGKLNTLEIRETLAKSWKNIISLQGEDISTTELKDILLNEPIQKDNGFSTTLKQVLEIDCHPTIIASLGRTLFNKTSTTSYVNVIKVGNENNNNNNNFTKK